MRNRIVIHATNTPADIELTADEIMEMNSQTRYQYPMPYHYVVQPSGLILKGKRDKELCGHCGKFSKESISVAYAGGIDEEGMPGNTLSEVQDEALRFVVGELRKRFPEATAHGANELLHPDEPPEDNEPYFDVRKWFGGV